MKPLARFTIRPSELGVVGAPGDLILGCMFKEQNHNLLAPGVIYEIVETMGEMVIRRVGESALQHHMLSTNWGNSVDQILGVSNRELVLTVGEASVRSLTHTLKQTD